MTRRRNHPRTEPIRPQPPSRRMDYNPSARWGVADVQDRYRALHRQLGGVDGFAPEPRCWTNAAGLTWVYNIMESVTDGVQLGDAACIELAVGYLEADLMHSGTGYLRERIARALRHAPLGDQQRERLRRLFVGQLRDGRMHKEYREYIRLFRRIGLGPYRAEIAVLAGTGQPDYVRRAAVRLLTDHKGATAVV